MPSVSDQFLSVFVAPLPFVLALVAIPVAIWKAMEWRYKGIIELWQTMHAQPTNEAEIAKTRSAELNDKVAALEKEVATLTEKAKAYPALRVPLTRLKQTTEDAKTLSAQSNVATTAVSTALSRHPYSFELAPSIVLKTTTERSDD